MALEMIEYFQNLTGTDVSVPKRAPHRTRYCQRKPARYIEKTQRTKSGKTACFQGKRVIVAFLAADESSFLTGQVIGWDGGSPAHQPTYGDEAN